MTLEETKNFLKNECIANCGHNANESCICKVAICFKEIEKAQEQDFNYNEIVLPFLNELVITLGINDMDEMLDKIKEQEKVLEIIKKKLVHIPQLLCAFENQLEVENPLEFYYNGQVGINVPMPLTQEEFELLKRYFE